MKKPDSIIFDMDGTLWDPMELYLHAWNNGLKESGVDKVLKKEELQPLMGVEGRKVLNILLPQYNEDQQKKIYEAVNAQRRALIQQGEGTLFDGMQDGIRRLSEKYRLFIVSNCPEGLIRLFMARAAITEYITDEMAYGVNHQPKYHNIQLLRDKHHLHHPVYVGDTDIDREQSEKAGIPFIFLSCGFGSTDKYDLTFADFSSFTDHMLQL